MRMGFGYDVHRLVPGDAVIIGGIRIPHTRRLAGHSDADVLLHAIGDALLGAAALGDLGVHFPSTDPRWRGADSGALLAQIGRMVVGAGHRIGNIDATVVLERPRLRPHIRPMREAIASALGVDMDRVSVKATTTDTLGAIGRGEGIAAWAVCLLTTQEADGDPSY